jgi:mono/diheme cytochrome c family protein
VGVRGEAPIGRSRVAGKCFSAAAAKYTAAAIILATTVRAVAQDNVGLDQALIDQGKAGYAEKCSHCHGPGMANSGTITPDLRKFPDDKERFFSTVKLGKNNKMPPWGDILTDEQIASLWAYVSSQRKKHE